MVYCGKTSTTGLACFRKGIGVGRGLVKGNPNLNLPKTVKGRTKKDEARDKELARVKKEIKPKIIKIKVKKKAPAPPKKDTRGVKAGTKRGGYKKSGAVLLKEKQSAAKALKKALEKAEKSGKPEKRGVKKGAKRGPYKK